LKSTYKYAGMLLSVLLLAGCSTTYPNKQITGLDFIKVAGSSLQSETANIPGMFEGQTTLLLLGYVQNSQFDIDRWLIGLDMTKTNVPTYEIPAIQGMVPRFFKTTIDDGMRKGIPKELWKGVITVYKDGERLQQFTGNTNPNNARVVLLNSSGKVVYFYDRGFSVDALKSLREKLTALN
jgi:hypothetical protein